MKVMGEIGCARRNARRPLRPARPVHGRRDPVRRPERCSGLAINELPDRVVAAGAHPAPDHAIGHPRRAFEVPRVIGEHVDRDAIDASGLIDAGGARGVKELEIDGRSSRSDMATPGRAMGANLRSESFGGGKNVGAVRRWHACRPAQNAQPS